MESCNTRLLKNSYCTDFSKVIAIIVDKNIIVGPPGFKLNMQAHEIK